MTITLRGLRAAIERADPHARLPVQAVRLRDRFHRFERVEGRRCAKGADIEAARLALETKRAEIDRADDTLAFVWGLVFDHLDEVAGLLGVDVGTLATAIEKAAIEEGAKLGSGIDEKRLQRAILAQMLGTIDRIRRNARDAAAETAAETAAERIVAARDAFDRARTLGSLGALCDLAIAAGWTIHASIDVDNGSRLPARRIAKLARMLPSETPVEVDRVRGHVRILGARSRYVFVENTLDPDRAGCTRYSGEAIGLGITSGG